MNVLTDNPATTTTTTAAASAQSIRILADDLTGACDSAVAFVAAGAGVRVWLGPVATHDSGEAVQAFNTASRGLESELAARAVSDAAASLAVADQNLWFKKVDSAGRGPIAAEVMAAHRTLGTRAVLFAPSFPEAGRTVSAGILRVDDVWGSSSQIPLGMMFQDDATAIVTDPGQIGGALRAGATVLVCDATTQDELEALAAVDEPGLLYAGSAGLAKALAGVRAGVNATAPQSLPVGVRAITICGTPHLVTRTQMDFLGNSLPGHPRLHIRVEAADKATVLDHFVRHDPEALLVTGGDTALFVLTLLGAHSIVLRGEVAAGIPWGVIQGGLADGRTVITKSGGFGAADTLTRIVRQLTGDTAA